MVNTVDCNTCGGSGTACAPGCDEESEHPTCPDCIRGRQPSPEVLGRMVDAFSDAYWEHCRENDVTDTPDTLQAFAVGLLAAWLAEHRKDEA